MNRIKKIENDTEVDRKLNQYVLNFYPKIDSFVEIGDNKYCLPAAYQDCEKQIRNFHVRDDDIIIASHPKTGTTWCQEMVWLIVNDLNYEAAKEYIIKRSPLLEVSLYIDPDVQEYNIWRDADPMMFYEMMPSPRLFKSHLAWPLLPEQILNGTKKTKIISIVRDPRDTCLSFYHHIRQRAGINLTLDEFSELFLSGRLSNGPFFKSILSYWEKRNLPNVLVLKYADMKKDLSGQIRKVASFLEKSLTDEEVHKLSDYLKFENMKNNPYANCLNLIRKGTVGGYKAEMSQDLIEQFDEWEAKNLKGADLSYD